MTGHKKWTSTSPVRKRQQRLEAGDFRPLVRKTRRPRGTAPVRDATKITAEQFLARHQYCCTVQDLERERKDALERGTYFPKDPKAVCNHEEDGLCGRRITEAQLKEVNSRLGGKSEEPELKTGLLETENKPKKSRTPRSPRVASVKPPERFFCLACNEWHEQGQPFYDKHSQFKRKRGRPSKEIAYIIAVREGDGK